MLVGGAGAGAGTYISTKIGPAELPQAVAAFHSWVFFTILNWTTFVYEMCVVICFCWRNISRFPLYLINFNFLLLLYIQSGGSGGSFHCSGWLHGGRSCPCVHFPQSLYLVSTKFLCVFLCEVLFVVKARVPLTARIHVMKILIFLSTSLLVFYLSTTAWVRGWVLSQPRARSSPMASCLVIWAARPWPCPAETTSTWAWYV